MIVSNPGYIVLELVGVVGLSLIAMQKSEWLFKRRHWLMLVVGMYISFIASSLNFKLLSSLTKLDLTNWLNWLNISASILLAGIIYGVNRKKPKIINHMVKLVLSKKFPAFIYIILYSVFSVPLQELLFRWYLINRLEPVIDSNLIIMLVSSAVFGMTHISFGSKIMVFSTFVLGMWWSYLFIATASIWPAIIGHGILGGYVLWLSTINNKKQIHHE